MKKRTITSLACATILTLGSVLLGATASNASVAPPGGGGCSGTPKVSQYIGDSDLNWVAESKNATCYEIRAMIWSGDKWYYGNTVIGVGKSTARSATECAGGSTPTGEGYQKNDGSGWVNVYYEKPQKCATSRPRTRDA